MTDLLMPLGFEPRPYQRKALYAAMQALDGPDRRALVTLATGLGKTCIIGGVLRNIRARGQKALVLCDRLDLADQLPRDIELATGELVAKETGKVKGWEGAGITVATIETVKLWPRTRLESMDLVVFDEAHRASSESRKELLLDRAQCKTALLGMTATPCGSKGVRIDDLFGKSVFSMSAIQGAQAGWLRPHEVHVLESCLDANVVFAQKDVDDAQAVAEIHRMTHRVLQQCCAIMGSGKFLVFCHRKRQAEAIVRGLCGLGIKAAFIHDEVVGKPRRDTFAGFENGDVQVIANVGVLREGFDSRVVTGAFFMTRTPNDVALTQMAGRVLRPGRGVIDGRTDPASRRRTIAESSLPVGKLVFLKMLNQAVPPIDELLGKQIVGKKRTKAQADQAADDDATPGFSLWDLYGDDELATAVSRAGHEDLEAMRLKAMGNRKSAGLDPTAWISVQCARIDLTASKRVPATRTHVFNLDHRLVAEVAKRALACGEEPWPERDDRWSMIATVHTMLRARALPTLTKHLFVEALGMDVAHMSGEHIEQVWWDMGEFRRKLDPCQPAKPATKSMSDQLWDIVRGNSPTATTSPAAVAV